MPKLIMVAGPSGVAKSPLVKSIERLHSELAKQLRKLVLYNDRKPRPGEEDGVDYYFRSREEIEELKNDSGYLVVLNRGDLQALELKSIDRTLEAGFHALYEGNPFIPARLREEGVFDKFDTLSIFLSPLSREEVLHAKEEGIDLQELLVDIQRRKLLHRTRREKGMLSLNDLENIETRANSAYEEVREAGKFDYVVPLHDGEGHDNWERFGIVIGSARRAVHKVAALIQGEKPHGVERWEVDLLP
jgi:guanylate kinase